MDYPIGKQIRSLTQIARGQKGTITPEEGQMFIELGIITEEDIERGKQTNKGKLQQARERKAQAEQRRSKARELNRQAEQALAQRKGKTHDEQ